MDTGVGSVNTDGQLFEVIIKRLRVQVRPKFIGVGAGARIRALSFFKGAKVKPPSCRGLFCSCLLMKIVPALKSTQSQVRPIASPCSSVRDSISFFVTRGKRCKRGWVGFDVVLYKDKRTPHANCAASVLIPFCFCRPSAGAIHNPPAAYGLRFVSMPP